MSMIIGTSPTVVSLHLWHHGCGLAAGCCQVWAAILEQTMASYTISAFQPARVRYVGVNDGLTSSEKEVELHLGETTLFVLLDRSFVDLKSGTVSVLITENPDVAGFVLVDVRGESTSGTRRVSVSRADFEAVAVR
jgi:hypothetical protein